MLTDDAVVEGSKVPGYERVFMVGTCDDRITLYSQQVRSLQLVHSAISTNTLRDCTYFAVVGAGAAGVTAAAAILLAIPGSRVDLIDAYDRPLNLQSGCKRRVLHPHLYDWPDEGSTNENADLPIMTWKSGTAAEIANSLERDLKIIEAHFPGRLTTKYQRRVHSLSLHKHGANESYRLGYVRSDNGEVDPQDPSAQYDAVFLTVGFGPEKRTFPSHMETGSYWEDNVTPGMNKRGKASTRILVTGNGDGGLIDAVSALVTDFDQGSIIRLINKHPSIRELSDPLLKIDRDAIAKEKAGGSIDLLNAYDSEILPIIFQTGLLGLLKGQIRKDVTLFFHTQTPSMLSLQTSRLNRLIFYLVRQLLLMRGGPSPAFRHIVGLQLQELDKRPAGLPPVDEQSEFIFKCDDLLFGVDAIVVRHGPDKAQPYKGWEAIAKAYKDFYDKWVKDDVERSVPRLSTSARQRYERECATHAISVPYACHAAFVGLASEIVTIELAGNESVRWHGKLSPVDLVTSWNNQAIYVHSKSSPIALGPLAYAIGRIVLHTDNIKLSSDDSGWQPFLQQLSSMNAREILAPLVPSNSPVQPPGIGYKVITKIDAAHEVHRSADRWLLDWVSAELTPFFDTGKDSLHAITWEIEKNIRQSMRKIWATWSESFTDADLLKWYLRLLASADEAQSIDDAIAIAGKRRCPAILRGFVFSLAVAAGWKNTSLRKDAPGNLERRISQQDKLTGHACTAEKIAGEMLNKRIPRIPWLSDYMLLSELTQTFEFALKTHASLRSVGKKELPRLDDVPISRAIVITADPELEGALSLGEQALARHLQRFDEYHKSRFTLQTD